MKKLIAKRLILYQGRNYNCGDPIPANDPVMTEAWLKAGSAAWEGAEEPLPAGPPSLEQKPHEDAAGVLRQEAERKTARILQDLGVELTDGEGRFVGEEALTDQLRELAKALVPNNDAAVPPEPEQKAAAVLRDLGVELTDEEGHFVGEDVLTDRIRDLAKGLLSESETVTQPGPVLDVDAAGHFTRESLKKLTKPELLDLAADMKVDLSKCRSNAERVDVLAAVNAEEALNGDGPPAEEAASGVSAAPEAVAT